MFGEMFEIALANYQKQTYGNGKQENIFGNKTNYL
jgi:hypothetical protein